MSMPELSQVLAKLREDLASAQRDGEGKDVRFLVDDVEIELQVALTDEGQANGGIKFWVLNAGAGIKAVDTTTQKLKLKLKVVDRAGKPLLVSDKDTRP